MTFKLNSGSQTRESIPGPQQKCGRAGGLANPPWSGTVERSTKHFVSVSRFFPCPLSALPLHPFEEGVQTLLLAVKLGVQSPLVMLLSAARVVPGGQLMQDQRYRLRDKLLPEYVNAMLQLLL